MGAENGFRVLRFGDWDKAQAILGQGMRPVYRAVGKAWNQEAAFLKRRLEQGIRDQAPGGRKFKPLAPTTLALRKFLGFGGTRALIGVSRQLIRSINVTKFGRLGSRDYKVFVGILSTATGSFRRNLFRIAKQNEFGSKPIVIRMTPKARRFFFAAMRSKSRRKWLGSRDRLSGRSTWFVVVRIPPRPVFEPVWKMWGPTSKLRVMMIVERELRGTYSR
jgi:hypothetical protein